MHLSASSINWGALKPIGFTSTPPAGWNVRPGSVFENAVFDKNGVPMATKGDIEEVTVTASRDDAPQKTPQGLPVKASSKWPYIVIPALIVGAILLSRKSGGGK